MSLIINYRIKKDVGKLEKNYYHTLIALIFNQLKFQFVAPKTTDNREVMMIKE